MLHLLWHEVYNFKVHLQGPMSLQLLHRALSSEPVTPNDLDMSQLGVEHPIFRMRCERSTECPTAADVGGSHHYIIINE